MSRLSTPQARTASTPGRWLSGAPARVLPAALGALCIALAVLVGGAFVSWWVTPGTAPGSVLSSAQSNQTVFPDSPATSPSSPVIEAVIPLGRSGIRVPILEYHYIRVDSNPSDRLGFNLSVTPANFSAQMDWLTSHDYHPVTFDDLRAYFQGRTSLPARPVVLTFDDGYQDFFTTAFPILQSHGFKAVSYIVPGFFGRQAYMTPAEVIQLDTSGLVEIGSHTVDHVNLTRSSPAEQTYQLQASENMLEHLLGHSVLDFCYPSGRFSAAVVAAVGKAGYVTATTEMPGTELAWSARLIWPRVRVSGGESLQMFVADLGQPEPSVAQSLPPSPLSL